MGRAYKLLSWLMDVLRLQLERCALWCAQAAFFFDKKHKPHYFRQALDEVTVSLDAFKERPLSIVETIAEADSKHAETAYYYFVLKQLSALWESESKALPLQVFNELRNAVDHFFRSLVDFGAGHETASQLRKVSAHLQRAILDVAKVLCAFYADGVMNRSRAVGEKTLGLVDSGEFLKALVRKQHQAHESYRSAREADLRIRADECSRDIVDLYLEAVLRHKALHDFYQAHLSRVRWAKYARWRYAAVSAMVTLVMAIAVELMVQGISGVVVPSIDGVLQWAGHPTLVE